MEAHPRQSKSWRPGQARAYLSRFHFDRVVSSAAGETPARFRRRVLLERAAYRLVTSDRGVLEIAVEAGYTSNETFVDAICEEPKVFTYGGMIAHVLTSAAHRRTLAIGALHTAGITDLGSGDPMMWVACNRTVPLASPW